MPSFELFIGSRARRAVAYLDIREEHETDDEIIKNWNLAIV
jgi:hypothetical protein